jgi:hypothetical protein
MKLIIHGREYDAVSLEKATLLHAMELKVQSRAITADGQGLGTKALEDLQRRAELTGAEADADANMLMFCVMVFFTRRAAGDRITFEEAASIGPGDFEVIREPGDTPEPQPEGPTAPGGPETPEAPGDLAAADAGPMNSPSTT